MEGSKKKEKIEVLEKDYGIKMNEELRKEIREMCNLDEYVAKRGKEEGLKKGKAEGLAQGIEKTTLEFSKFIQNMMNSHHFTAEEIFDMMQIPEEKRKKYRQYLKDPS